MIKKLSKYDIELKMLNIFYSKNSGIISHIFDKIKDLILENNIDYSLSLEEHNNKCKTKMKSKFLIIDSIERNNNAQEQIDLIPTLLHDTEKFNTQVFTATNSPFILGTTPNENIFILESEKDDYSDFTWSHPECCYGMNANYITSCVMEIGDRWVPEISKKISEAFELLYRKENYERTKHIINELRKTIKDDSDLLYLEMLYTKDFVI